MLTKSKIHWLEIDYREQDMPKAYVVRMDKHDYLHILDAVKTTPAKTRKFWVTPTSERSETPHSIRSKTKRRAPMKGARLCLNREARAAEQFYRP